MVPAIGTGMDDVVHPAKIPPFVVTPMGMVTPGGPCYTCIGIDLAAANALASRTGQTIIAIQGTLNSRWTRIDVGFRPSTAIPTQFMIGIRKQ